MKLFNVFDMIGKSKSDPRSGPLLFEVMHMTPVSRMFFCFVLFFLERSERICLNENEEEHGFAFLTVGNCE